MTEPEWRTSYSPYQMMIFLIRQQGMCRRREDRRRLHLFGCFSCRQLWHAMTDDRSKHAVEVAERFADYQVSPEEVNVVRAEAYEVHDSVSQRYRDDREQCLLEGNRRGWLGKDEQVAADAAAYILHPQATEFALVDLNIEYYPDEPEYPVFHRRRLAQCRIPRCIFGDFFHTVPLVPAWRTATTFALAHAAYNARSLPDGLLERDRLAVLSDALEEAGCEEESVLDHFRGPSPHVRGCWALDLIRGTPTRKQPIPPLASSRGGDSCER